MKIDYNNNNEVNDLLLAKYYEKVATRIESSTAENRPLSFEEFKKKYKQNVKSRKKHYYKPSTTGNHLPFGIYSLSTDPCNIQMWSYYSGGHNGVCVAFEIDWNQIISAMQSRLNISLNELKEILKNDGFRFSWQDKNGDQVHFGFQCVKYSQSVPNYPVDKFMQAYFDKAVQDELSWILTQTKDIGWAHEKECRLVCFSRWSEEPSDLLPLNIFNFIRPCGIILGINMDPSIKEVVKKFYAHLFPIIELSQINDESVIDYSPVLDKAQIFNKLKQYKS